MADFPALPLWTDAFIGDTHHLTPAECGAYMRLLMAAWRSPDCSLPTDDKTLGRIIGEPRQWKRLKPTVLAFWTIGDDGRMHQKRLLREYEFVTRKRTQARTAAAAKHLKNNKSGVADASSEHVPCARASSTPTPNKSSEANASDGEAPSKGGGSDPVEAIKRAIFDEGRSLLCQARNIAPSTAGGLVVKWVKASGDNYTAILAAIRQACVQTPTPADPYTWILARVRTDKPKSWQDEEADRSKAFNKAMDEVFRQ